MKDFNKDDLKILTCAIDSLEFHLSALRPRDTKSLIVSEAKKALDKLFQEFSIVIPDTLDEFAKQYPLAPNEAFPSNNKISDQVNWLMINTNLDVEKILDFTERFKPNQEEKA